MPLRLMWFDDVKQEECSCQSMHIRVRICVDGCVNRHGIIKELVCMGMYPGCGRCVMMCESDEEMCDEM